MKIFKSKTERNLWLTAAILQLTIYATIGIARPLSGFLRENDLLTPLFISGMVLVAACVLALSLRIRPGIRTLGIVIGIIAVYVMVLIRIEVPEERTHIIEYGVIAILVYHAIIERIGKRNLLIALIAVLITTILGTIDESIQWLVPDRVFDPQDILFNCIAAAMAVGSGWLLHLIVGKRQKRT